VFEHFGNEQDAHAHPHLLTSPYRRLWRTIRNTLCVVAACAASVSAGAGSTSTEVAVNITLSAAAQRDLCSNVALAEGGRAFVSVLCATPQVISIVSSTDSALAARGAWLGIGNVTAGVSEAAFRSYSLDPGAGRLEVLVTF
jgi:hypothetical protein